MSTCPTCQGTGSQRDGQREALVPCPTCQGAGCDHHAAWVVRGTHCQVCEQDDTCRACQRNADRKTQAEPIPAQQGEDDLELEEPSSSSG